MNGYVIGIDQGTTSTRAIVFDHSGVEKGRSQREHRQYYPRPGWTEHDAVEILANTRKVIEGALQSAGVGVGEVVAVGIANQTETTVLWDTATGDPIAPAITWQDTRGDAVLRTLAIDGELARRVEDECFVEVNGYFSATKIRWMLDNVPAARELLAQHRLAFGSMESWLTWNLTGGARGGVHVTDASNASRTLLMHLTKQTWSDSALEFFGIPAEIMPTIMPTSGQIAVIHESETLGGVPLTALMGDQQAATFGQTAFEAGEAKCTYGTGNFLIYNTGKTPQRSRNGLITTVIYHRDGEDAVYGLEGSIAVTGSLIQWLRDGLGVIGSAADSESLALSVPDSGGVCIVPAFSGLYAPYWRGDVRGTVIGLTHHSTAAHLVRASLESCAFQTYDLIGAANADTSVPLDALRVDGGMTRNEILMQFQADLLGVPVSRSATIEMAALGVSYAAGLAVGFWRDLVEVRALWTEGGRFEPSMSETNRSRELARWNRALAATFAGADPDPV